MSRQSENHTPPRAARSLPFVMRLASECDGRSPRLMIATGYLDDDKLLTPPTEVEDDGA
jgi:hypothetical protein